MRVEVQVLESAVLDLQLARAIGVRTFHLFDHLPARENKFRVRFLGNAPVSVQHAVVGPFCAIASRKTTDQAHAIIDGGDGLDYGSDVRDQLFKTVTKNTQEAF